MLKPTAASQRVPIAAVQVGNRWVFRSNQLEGLKSVALLLHCRTRTTVMSVNVASVCGLVLKAELLLGT